MFLYILKSITLVFMLLLLLLMTNLFTINSAIAIIGGRDARNGEFPFFAALARVKEPPLQPSIFCGAVLIEQRWVLTVAHCLENETKSSLRIILDKYNRSSATSRQVIIEIDQVYLYDHLGPISKDYLDIALIKLSKRAPVYFTPAIYAPYEQPQIGISGTMMGFGLMKSHPITYADRLQVMEPVPIIELTKCDYDDVHSFNKEVQFCAGYLDRHIYTQEGDSGGPFITYLDGYSIALILGLLHRGPLPDLDPAPSVYTKLSYFYPWIEATMCKNGGPC